MARQNAEINAGSMADIAFLLLIFFLVTTTIASDRGLQEQLPPKDEAQQDIKIKMRNVYSIIVNSQDKLLIEDEPGEIEQIREGIIKHLTNEGVDPDFAENSKDAIVTVKADRGTTYEVYIRIKDEIKKAYAQVRADYLKVSVSKYMEIAKQKTPEHEELYDKAKEKYPFNVADAEPSSAAGAAE
jgi:biopolymer transport protein ExbD